jgi:DNA-binding transcriptional ArsR family regulator
MIRIEVPDAAFTQLRVAHSPLWESLCALLVTRIPDPVPFPYQTWAAAARTTLRTPTLRPLAEWVCSWPSAEIPDFLLAVPTAQRPRLADELAALRATPAEAVSSWLAARPARDHVAFEDLTRAPEETLARLADALAEFWEQALAPWWPRVTAAIEEDILLRGRSLLVEGYEALLDGLHARLRWEDHALQVDATGPAQPEPARPVAGLTLVPLLFAHGAVHLARDPDGIQAVSYQARGAALLTDDARGRPAPPATATERLAQLVGPTRATICSMLVTPASTTGLAGQLALAPSTVSDHLRTLLAAGLIDRRRAGSRVLYTLSGAGCAVLRSLDGIRTT